MNLYRLMNFETTFLIVLAVASIFSFYFFPLHEINKFMFLNNSSIIFPEENLVLVDAERKTEDKMNAEISEKDQLIDARVVFDTAGIENFIDDTFLNTRQAPSNYLLEEHIEVYDDRIVIYVNGSSLSHYADSGSMKPLLDSGSNGIRVQVTSADEINVGDIISFRQEDLLIVHRVIEKGVDEAGTYFITKGDNNMLSDGKIRFESIEYKTIGVLW